MNREDIKKAIAVMQAYVDGEEIEYAKRGIPGVGTACSWDSHDYTPNFDWHNYDYRIKPKPREVWVSNQSFSQAGAQWHNVEVIEPEELENYTKFREVTDE